VSSPPDYAQVENQAGKAVAAQFFDGLLELSAGLLVEARDPYVADARPHEEGALDAGACISSGVRTRCLMPAEPGGLHQAAPAAGGTPKELGELVQVEPVDGVSVDGDNLVARREAGLGGGSAGQRLEHNHPAGRSETTLPKPF